MRIGVVNRTILVSFLLLPLSGCIGVSTNRCFTCAVSVWTDYGTGGHIFQIASMSSYQDVQNVARTYCSERGLAAPKIGPRMPNKFDQNDSEYDFTCGDRTVANPNIVSPTPVKSTEVERLQAEAEASRQRQRQLEEERNQARQQPAPVSGASITNIDRLSLDVSKSKCTELGFKPGTEAFGKCVLQLSK